MAGERFISADIIVQSPANPQTLNSYSYCVNNPLKYVDPSGHEVTFAIFDFINACYEAGIDPGEAYQEFQTLLAAWELLSEVEPEVTQIIEDSAAVFVIMSGNLSERTLGTSILSSDGTGGYVILDINQINPDREGVEGIAVVLAHESIHCAVYALEIAIGLAPHTPTQYEETIAFQFQYHVTKELEYSSGPGWRFWEYFLSTPMQDSYNLAKRATQRANLSISPGTYKLKLQMKDVFKYQLRYLRLPAYPSSSYYGIMESIINLFL